MKFGKNLVHLSIPEWKVYNLDYNDLKAEIRAVTNLPNHDLSPLQHKFLANFEYLDLFVSTKSGEISRKLVSHALQLKAIVGSPALTLAKLDQLDSIHLNAINEVSLELRKLNKFLVVQKIAVRKIFKKLCKHYPDPAAAQALVANLNRVLHNDRSFMQFDSSAQTSKLLKLLLDIDHELRALQAQLHRPKVAQARSSTGSIRTMPESIATASDEPILDFDISSTLADAVRFDLITALKKNFFLHTLLPKDLASRNDFTLSMEVFLKIPKVCTKTRISMVYLAVSAEDPCPSMAISYQDSQLSILIVYTGGLRKYLYCIVPNDVLETLYSVCSSSALMLDTQNLLLAKFRSISISNKAERLVRHIAQANIKPTLKVILDRSRYVLKPSADEPLDAFQTLNHDHGNSIASSSTTFKNDFDLLIDENIYTTANVPLKNCYDTSTMDPFPFNYFTIASNDPTLHDFEDSLTTNITGNVLQNTFRPILAKKLPAKIQSILKTSSMYMFKNFSLTEYMRSCYYNTIPQDTNNHFSRLLSVNLFKNHESVEFVNNQDCVDDSIIQDKNRVIFKRQQSYRSLQSAAGGFDDEHYNSDSTSNKTSPNPYNDLTNPFEHHSEYYLRKLSLIEQSNDENNEQSYIMYLGLNNNLDDTLLNNLVLLFIRLKYHPANPFRSKPTPHDPYLLSRQYGGHKAHPAKFPELTYDSINEDMTYMNNTNDYQLKLISDYDHILSIFYFTLCSSSIFISGINIGILCSLQRLQQDDLKFSILDNPIIVCLLIFGFLVSLICSMTSIALSTKCFSPLSATHSAILWSGLTLVICIIMWTSLNFLG